DSVPGHHILKGLVEATDPQVPPQEQHVEAPGDSVVPGKAHPVLARYISDLVHKKLDSVEQLAQRVC
ncbi:MAG TPA: hypothetical protein PLA43_21140, partial [Bryobacteraceae bacterium]|nr:hypothetical protein [Bryobacteraceae bacterium]